MNRARLTAGEYSELRWRFPVESQITVFRKYDAFSNDLINPSNARAIYFNDQVAVGWVRGGPFLEIASVDPRQGTIFYALNQSRTPSPG